MFGYSSLSVTAWYRLMSHIWDRRSCMVFFELFNLLTIALNFLFLYDSRRGDYSNNFFL